MLRGGDEDFQVVLILCAVRFAGGSLRGLFVMIGKAVDNRQGAVELFRKEEAH
jgi:hypothetical protein